ncbi:MAG: hypothetical protein Q9225_005511 [Loekoesia sp. 1 TL-2023]
MSREQSPEAEDRGDREPIWDEKETYFPLFQLAKAPADYWDEINYYCQGRASWLAVSSSTPSFPQALSEIKSHLEDESSESVPTPFLGDTVLHVYRFFRDHLREPEDSTILHPFTHFTFLAVDAECVQPSESLRIPEIPDGSPYRTDSIYTILLCSDAPDFNESDAQPRLKQLRLPIAAALEHLNAVEQLTMAPREVYTAVYEDPEADVIKLLPPAKMIPIPPYTNSQDQEYKVGTPAESRIRKHQGLRIAQEAGSGLGSLF